MDGNLIKFRTPNPVLLAGPANPDIEMLEQFSRRGFKIVAADGGANLLFAHHVQPTAIIGDLDSFDANTPIHDHVDLIKLEEQQSTDFEKCLYSVDAPLFLAFGFIGLRFDHTLANVHAMAKYAHRKRVALIGSQDFSFIQIGALELNCKTGDTVSIFPLSPIKFQTSNGLGFPLDKLAFNIGEMIGTSNQATADTIEIIPTHDSLKTPYLITLPLERLSDFVAAYD